LVNRSANLIDEGIDIALRAGHLPGSSMIAARIGDVPRVVVAAPSYLTKTLGLASSATCHSSRSSP
jgi:DNA-binding transcriptional LysR family regulator